MPSLTAEAGLEKLTPMLGEATLESLASFYEEDRGGRMALLSHLKGLGIGNLVERQKLVNTLAKAKREGRLKPYRDERAALKASLADKQISDSRSAPVDWLSKATGLKERGNEAFKAARFSEAVDTYGDAVFAAMQAAKEISSAAAAMSMLGPLYSNMAATYLRLEDWTAAATNANEALEREPSSTKA